MASGKFVDEANAVLDEWFGNVPATIPATWYMALFSVVPNKNGGGTEITDQPGYPRIAIDNNTDIWPVAVNGRKQNAEQVDHTQAPSDLGQCVAAALVNTETGPYTFGVFGHLKTPVTIRNGQTRFWPVGSITLIEA